MSSNENIFFSISLDLNIRLHGGGRNYGRIEILYNGKWGTICNTTWMHINSMVICKQLGFVDGTTFVSGPLRPLPAMKETPVYMEKIWCREDDIHILSCPNNGWKRVDPKCLDHSRDAAVYCFFAGKYSRKYQIITYI